MLQDTRIRIALVAILAVAALLRFWNLTGPDIIGDDATYSFRSIGYFDWIASLDTQTTPVVWFEKPVWWQKLSFHDAPPLAFVVQWFFFRIFGDTVFAARLPFVLAGLFAVFGMFLLGRKLAGPRVGLLAAGALAVMNFHVWISRLGFLDGFVVVWVIYSLYFFLKARENARHYLSWWVTVALGLLSKYTFLFMGPLYLLLLLIFARSAWRNKWFWIGACVFLVLFSPVIIYNAMAYVTRGHFDAAFSTLFGMSPEDYRILVRRVRTDPRGIFGAMQNAWNELSPAFGAAFFAGLFTLFIRARRISKERFLATLLIAGILFALLMLAAVGGDNRFATVLAPFIAILIAYAASYLFEWSKGKRLERAGLLTIGAIFVAWEVAFAAQSQLVAEPFLKWRSFTAPHRPAWEGYNALDAYVDDFYRRFPDSNYVVFATTPQIRAYKTRVIQSFYDASPVPRPQQKNLLVFDDRMEWYAFVWIVERRRLYDAAAMPSLMNLIEAIDGKYVSELRKFGFEDAYVVTVTDKLLHNESIQNRERIERFVAALKEAQAPVDEIQDYRGEVVFRIFRVPLAGYE